MIELKDLEEALQENKKRLSEIEAENRVFCRLIELENSKTAETEIEQNENVETENI